MGYGGHQLRLKCAQVHDHSPAGTFARVPGRCLRWSPTPPGPRWSPALNIYNIIYNIQMNRDRSFTSIQTVHTHTPCLWQGGVQANEVKMRMKRGMNMKWKWKWDEGLLNRDPRRGTQNKRGGANTNTNTPGPERANPERARGRKSGDGRTQSKTSGGGGKTEALEPT